MKKKKLKGLLVASMLVLLVTNIIVAQVPQAIPYQAVARGANGVAIANKALLLRFSILQNGGIPWVPYPGSNPTNQEYQETQSATTNALGMIIVNIGMGNPTSNGSVNSFSDINWSSGTKFIQVELDSSNTGSAFTIMGSQQLMSVPYALNAVTAVNSSDGEPVGTVEAFAGDISNIPSGWHLCDGSAQSKYDPMFADLYKVIGTIWGSKGDSLSFYLPDTRGYFIRGTDLGANHDPDLGLRTITFGGSPTQTLVGTYQPDMFASHTHNLSNSVSGNTGNTNDNSANVDAVNRYGLIQNVYALPNGGNETRPRNIYMNYIIKL